ncbi:T-cell immunoreceptor with Ig and ITIM domains [Bombina bombina]|uniref:T-cell immunoreceptor with Ig and ITIM domains n=1 Tax=Bombina bombina TaxID=8345 RepID=UPI00235A6262|nr:T-cell immunoreceptor with Ig and ITIM domains [Bombina bombina]
MYLFPLFHSVSLLPQAIVCSILHMTGVLGDTFIRTHNITAAEGSDVTLRCELSLFHGKITQVNWMKCNHTYLAFYLNKSKTAGQVAQGFLQKVTLEDKYGITILSVNSNDTGQYCCIYNTFPKGKMEGKIFLVVTATDFWWNSGLYICILPAALLVIGTVGFFCSKKKTRLKSVKQSSSPSLARSADRIQQSLATVTVTHEEDNDGPEYFNIWLYQKP